MSDHRSAGRYGRLICRMTQVSSSLPPLRKNAQSTGMTVSEKISEPTIANEIANAIGRNIFPSTPSSVKSGRKTMMMMAIANTIGRPTSVAARRITCARDSRTGTAPGSVACARLGQVAIDVLHHHDAAVDHHADADRETAEAHEVRAEAVVRS